MAKACVRVGLYGGVSCGIGFEPVRPVRTLPHASDPNAYAFCRIWYTSGENEWKIKAMVPNRVGAGSTYMSGVELVQVGRTRDDLGAARSVKCMV